MNLTLTDLLSQAASCLPPMAKSRKVILGAAILAITGTLLEPLAQAAEADPPAPRLQLDFVRLTCSNETPDPGGSDEPYVVMFAGDLSGPTPKSRAYRTFVFGGMDAGEIREQTVGLWNAALARDALRLSALHRMALLEIAGLSRSRRELVGLAGAASRAVNQPHMKRSIRCTKC